MNSDFVKMDSSLMNLTNMRVVLKLIKQANQISRSEISKETGLTPPTVYRILKTLKEHYNLVKEVGLGYPNGGRPPILVEFNSQGNYIIGIDIGATYIRGCLVDLAANSLFEIQNITEIEQGFNGVINKVVKIINKLTARVEKKGRIWGVGIGVAGLVNKKTGIIESSPDFGWTGINFREELKKHLNIPFFYDNSTRLMALGELSFGKNQNLKNFAVIGIGYGIAAGLVIGGKLVKGHDGFAGEFGHIIIDKDKKVKCKCGMTGCLEALASGHRIANLGKNIVLRNKSDMLKELSNNDINFVTAELVAKAAKKGDPECYRVFSDITEYLSQGIGVLANLFNPEVIFIGGGISLNGKFFFDLIEEKKLNYLLHPNKNVKILPVTFGEQATSIGAVALILEKIMNLEL